jgi:hypothetical protein
MENNSPKRRVVVVSEPKNIGNGPVFTGPSINNSNTNTAPNNQPNPYNYIAPVNEKGQKIDRLNIDAIKAKFAKATKGDSLDLDEDEEEEEVITPASTEKPAYKPSRISTKMKSESDYSYERLELPSNGFLYPNEIFIRPLSVPDLIDLHPARKKDPVTNSYNQTLMLDVLSRTVSNIDIRDLHIGDFRFIFYWLKINSFTKTPLNINFTSKYGNRNKATIKKSDINIETLDDEAIVEYIEKGYKAPTIREGEEFQSYLLSYPEAERERLEYMFSYVQFVQGDDLQGKIDNFYNLTPDDMYDIVQFSKLLNKYGVIEVVEVVDQHFEVDKALELLKSEKAELDEFDINSVNNDAFYNAVLEKKKEINDELNRINDLISKGKEVRPTKEKIAFKLDLESFFPELL